jgi:predicted HTH domain antitoxin
MQIFVTVLRRVAMAMHDEWLLAYGPERALALQLVAAGQASLPQGARLSNMALEDFISLLGEAGVVAVDYDPDELEQELATYPSSDSDPQPSVYG